VVQGGLAIDHKILNAVLKAGT